MMKLSEIGPIADVPVELEMHLDRRVIPLAQILEWRPGTILWLTRSAGDDIDIFTGGTLLACGEIVVIENRFGVRVTDFRPEE